MFGFIIVTAQMERDPHSLVTGSNIQIDTVTSLYFDWKPLQRDLQILDLTHQLSTRAQW